MTQSLGADTIYGDAFIAKFDANGMLIWNRTWGGSEYDYASDVYVDSYERVHLVCTTYSYGAGDADVAYLRYNSTGFADYTTIWGGAGSDRAKAIEQGSNDNFIISGQTSSFGSGNADTFILAFDISGTFLWNTTWGTNRLDRVDNLAIDSNNNIYLAGWTYYPAYDMDTTGIYDISYVLVKIDSDGNAIWSRWWGSSEYRDYGAGVAIDSTDNIYFVGQGLNGGWGIINVYMAKFTTDGVLVSETIWGGGHHEYPHSITIDKATDDIFIAGDSSSFNLARSADILLLKNPTFPPETSNGVTTNDTIPAFSLFIFICLTTIIALVISKRKLVKT